MTRKITNKLMDLVDEGMLTWEQIAMGALGYMSEDDVAGMARVNELIPDEDEEDDEEEDDIDALLREGDDDEYLRVVRMEANEADAAVTAVAQFIAREEAAAVAALFCELDEVDAKKECMLELKAAAEYARILADQYTTEGGDYFVNWKANYAYAYARRLQELQK
jgi:hypothetical protein